MCDVQREIEIRNLWQKLRRSDATISRPDITRSLNITACRGRRPRLQRRAVLRKGVDSRKDQSYFLFSLRQEQLQRALTPLGRMSKSEIRAIARKIGLRVADKAGQPGDLFRARTGLQSIPPIASWREPISSAAEFTISTVTSLRRTAGLRCLPLASAKGLPGGSAQPRYVVDLDPETNRVIVGQAEDLLVEEFEIDRVNWISGAGNDDPGPRSATAATMAREVTVKIRYNHPGTRATLMPMENQRARIRLRDPQKPLPQDRRRCFTMMTLSLAAAGFAGRRNW